MATMKAVSIRAMNRERITAAILETAREQIADSGAAGLSLRAISRELGMASSAIYRYFPGRDDLLTKLIVDSYDSLGEAAERAEARVDRHDLPGRFRAICRSVRLWALANTHEYFLIYGTPVPGYQAPENTIAPATRVATLLIGVLTEVATSRPAKHRATPVSPGLKRALAPIRRSVAPEIPDADLATGLSIFSALFGAVSFEINGQLHNVIGESKEARSTYFDSQVDAWLHELGLPS